MSCYKCNRAGYNMTKLAKGYICNKCMCQDGDNNTISSGRVSSSGMFVDTSLPNIISRNEWNDIAKICKEVSKSRP